MMRKRYDQARRAVLAPGILAILPTPLFAKTFADVATELLGYFQTLFGMVFGIIFVYVAYSLVNSWILHGDDPKEVEAGRQKLIAAIVGTVVLSSLWGLVAIAQLILK